MKKINVSLVLYSALLGGFVGLVTWIFLGLSEAGITFLWEVLPNYIHIGYWALILGLVGGILVGCTQTYFGSYPKEINEIMLEFKQTKRIDYTPLPKVVISALTVLWFGASLGPEAALSGIVGGVVTWISETIRNKFKRDQDVDYYMDTLTDSSVYGGMGMLFRSPLLGLYPLLEDRTQEKETIKRMRLIIYIVTTVAGFGMYLLLSQLMPRESFISRFGNSTIGVREILFLVVLIVLSVLLGWFYNLLGMGLQKILGFLKGHLRVKAILGGLAIGILGTWLPYTLNSGQHQLKVLFTNWENMGACLLILITFVKLFLTKFCLETGWRGGHIYPLIYCGSCAGFALSMLFSLDPVFCTAVVTTGLIATVMRNVAAPMIILVFFFPIEVILPMLLTALIGKVSNDIFRKKTAKDTSELF